jgi:tetratricopeptide (TPR) repeat protein
MATRTTQALRNSTLTDVTEPASVAQGRYRIEARLGRGGAASVYLAVELATGKRVAVKRLVENASPRLASLFELEYHTLSSIKHPNVVEVYDYGTDASGPYYVMELLEGSDLSAQRRIEWRTAAAYAIEVASALSVLHARRVVHRDVSARNVWCVEGGGLKLIDFGALTSFGTCKDVVGTPPHVAPEALRSQPLDQRTDLYALGGLLYWLLTGVHAFPARSLRELPRLWAEPAVSVSEQLERLGRERGDLPKELDALVMALLSENPLARPSTTGEVIDRLSAVLGRVSTAEYATADIGLEQPDLTGRDRERKEFKRQVEQVSQGRGEATVFAARPGCGRTRLLMELAVDARIFGAQVVHVQAGSCVGAHGVADAIAQRLLEALPDVAPRAAEEYAPLLGHLSRDMEQRLGVPLKAMPQVAGEARAHIHEALSSFVAKLAAHGLLVILVDDLESADESSVAWLAALAARCADMKLLLGVSLVESGDEERSFAIKALRHHARRVALRPLGAPETHKLLASLFGEVPYLVRMSERLYRATHGVPGRVVELARHLVREGLISNADGTWVLPQELPEEQLVLDRNERVKVSIARLSDDARQLGGMLSVRHGPLPIELCKALAELPPQRLFSALEELSREGLLGSNALGYCFEDEVVQSGLRQLLSVAEAESAHRRLGAFLIAQPHESDVLRLEALVHCMEGGDLSDAPHEVARIAFSVTKDAPDRAVESAPAMERALKLYRASGRGDHDVVGLLGALSVAGYFSDRRLSARYGERALKAIGDLLKVPLMHRLRPFIGRKLSLIVSLIVAGIRLRRRPVSGSPSLQDVLQLYFHALGSLSGVSTICVDPQSVQRCAWLSEPFAALGKGHIASFIHEFTKSLAMTVTDRPSEARARWLALIAQLERPEVRRNFPEQLYIRYLAGALYAYGVLECWRDSPVALTVADRLESFGLRLYQMSADQVRAVYYANQGNRELYEKYRERAELHAIQRGSAWQIETWAPGAAITIHMRTYDAMGLKDSQEQLTRLERRIPSLALLARRSRGAFLFLRKRYEEALPQLEECAAEEPLGVIGWGRAQGVLAGCLNGLGDHERARRVCLDALAKLRPDDLDFPAMNLGLQIELAHAESGLGDHALAATQLDALLVKHAAGNGPLTLGALHEARARVALAQADKETCELHTREMDSRYQATQIASLVACCEGFAREQRRVFAPAARRLEIEGVSAISTGFSMGPTTLERTLMEAAGSFEARAAKALGVVAEQLGNAPAALYLTLEAGVQLAAFTGTSEPHRDLQKWVDERIRLSANDDVTQTDFAEGVQDDPDVLVLGGARHRVFMLISYQEDQEILMGAVTFEETPDVRHFVPPAVLHSIAGWLHRTLTHPSVVTSLASRSILRE